MKKWILITIFVFVSMVWIAHLVSPSTYLVIVLIISSILLCYLVAGFIREMFFGLPKDRIKPIESHHKEILSENSKIESCDNKTDRLFKWVAIGGTLTVFISLAYFYSISDSLANPGVGMALFFLLLPLLPMLPFLLVLPVYFLILSQRYYREKSSMDILDKIEFYLLLAGFIVVLIALNV